MLWIAGAGVVWPHSPAAERAHTLSVAKQYVSQLEGRLAHPVQVRAQAPCTTQLFTK